MYRCYSSHWDPRGPRISIVGEHKDGVLRLAASRCSPKDRFMRKIGREIAEDRLKNGKFLMELKTKECNSEKFHEYAHMLITDILKNGLTVS